MIMLALDKGVPKLMSLKDMLQKYLEFQEEVVRRRTEHDLKKAKERAHVLEGLRRAVDLVDEINSLKKELVKTTKEKDRILGLKIAYQGYDILEGEEGEDTSSEKKEGESRFYKLTEVDNIYLDPSYTPIEFDNSYNLQQICEHLRVNLCCFTYRLLSCRCCSCCFW